MTQQDLPKPGMRWESTSEHIARDMQEGRFPEQSERKQVPVKEEIRCPHCDGTGMVHRADGEYMGDCRHDED